MAGLISETQKRWAERVAAWRSSGQSSYEFCEGRAFTAGGLRHWAHRLKKGTAAKPSGPSSRPALRLVRLGRRPTSAASVTPAMDGPCESAGVSVHSGAVRIVVARG